MNHEKSKQLYKEACEIIPGGVNSPVRAFHSVGETPIFVKRGNKAILTDVDDNHYIDYVCSWGPLILGHNSDVATKNLNEAIQAGTSFGMPTEIETKLARIIVSHYKAIDKVRMVSSGTEATMSALRLARGYTKKDKIIKFEGCYHGHSDNLLIKSGSGALTSGIPTSAGVPKSIVKDTLVARYNDIDSVKALIYEYKDEIAAVIIEPIPGNMGLIEAKLNFLVELRQLTKENQIVLIFDEVISGFRIQFDGASGYYNIEPDLICLGKIIGGGMPVGAYGGKLEIMNSIAPLGDVYQAGTLSGNPIAMHMGYNVLTYLKNNNQVYTYLETLAIQLQEGFQDNLNKLNIENVTINRVGSMLCQFFAKSPVDSYESVMKSNTEQYAFYFREMLKSGILIAPAQYECLFVSTAHTSSQIEETIRCHFEAMKKVKDKWPII